MLDSQEKEIKEFAQDICKLETMDFIGIVTILGVPLSEGWDEEKKEWKGRDGEVVVRESIEKFASLNREGRRQIMQILRAIVTGKNQKVKKHGTRAKN